MPALYTYPATSDGLWWTSTTPTSTSTASTSTVSVWLDNSTATITSAASTATGYVLWTTGGTAPPVWWNTQPAPTVYREPIWRVDDRAPPLCRPAVIRRRTVREHARETIQRVDAVHDANEVKRRARRLLLSHLTPEQRQTFVENGWFIVEGGRSRQRYRIRDKNYAGNIDVLEGERVSHRLCCHASSELPVADHLLAQKIMLEIAEDDFLRLANRHAA